MAIRNWLKSWLGKYNQLCDELNSNKGANCGCVPVVKFDPEDKLMEQAQAKKSEESA